MGYTTLSSLAENLDLEAAIQIHLRSNLFPPVPLTMVEPCKEAIFSILNYEGHRQITLPEGVSWRGKSEAPAWAIVEENHLEAFVDNFFDARFDGDDDC